MAITNPCIMSCLSKECLLNVFYHLFNHKDIPSVRYKHAKSILFTCTKWRVRTSFSLINGDLIWKQPVGYEALYEAISISRFEQLIALGHTLLTSPSLAKLVHILRLEPSTKSDNATSTTILVQVLQKLNLTLFIDLSDCFSSNKLALQCLSARSFRLIILGIRLTKHDNGVFKSINQITSLSELTVFVTRTYSWSDATDEPLHVKRLTVLDWACDKLRPDAVGPMLQFLSRSHFPRKIIFSLRLNNEVRTDEVAPLKAFFKRHKVILLNVHNASKALQALLWDLPRHAWVAVVRPLHGIPSPQLLFHKPIRVFSLTLQCVFPSNMAAEHLMDIIWHIEKMAAQPCGWRKGDIELEVDLDGLVNKRDIDRLRSITEIPDVSKQIASLTANGVGLKVSYTVNHESGRTIFNKIGAKVVI